DLDVEQRHKPAEAHHHEREEAAQPAGGVGRHCAYSAAGRVSTLTVVERPGRNSPSRASASSRAMRTGTRCTILVNLPVAFSGGMTLKIAPVPGARLST